MASGGPVGSHSTGPSGEAKYTPTQYATAGDLGSETLPYAPTGVVWRAGGVATAKWSIRANHGGGYSYRLCRRSAEPVTEECFRRTPLRFATRVHTLEWADGSSATINGTYVSAGTRPAGDVCSEWLRLYLG